MVASPNLGVAVEAAIDHVVVQLDVRIPAVHELGEVRERESLEADRRVFMRLPSLLVMISAITCSSPVLSGAGWRRMRAEYCWPSCCQLMVLAVVLVSSSFMRDFLHVAREHDLLGLRHDFGGAFRNRFGDQRNLRRAIRPW